MSQQYSKLNRDIELSWTSNSLTGSGALFLWGPRQTGKTTLLKERYPDARGYDLLDTDLSAELSVRPRLLREQVLAEEPSLVIVDEVQQVPALLEEVHWLLENTGTRFVLCGSSARKLRRISRNLLGGRAVDFHLLPLTSNEIGEVDLNHLLQFGALPPHYLAEKPGPLLKAYVNNYLKQEIIDESVTRNVPAFSRFMRVLGLTHGQQLNHSNVARETGVSASTVRNYYQIVEDTLLGSTLEPWRRRKKRRLVETAKFYLFDVGVANQLHPESWNLGEGTDRYGRAFEHFILNELLALIAYRGLDLELSYWRTHSGFEVDFIVGNMDLAIECKAARDVRGADLRGLRALREDQVPRRSILVSRDPRHRKTEDGIEMIPWKEFCQELWAGKFF